MTVVAANTVCQSRTLLLDNSSMMLQQAWEALMYHRTQHGMLNVSISLHSGVRPTAGWQGGVGRGGGK